MNWYTNFLCNYKQDENQATKILLNILELNVKYAIEFIYLFTKEDKINKNAKINFFHQRVPESLANEMRSKNILLCISEDSKYEQNDLINKSNSRPDGVIKIKDYDKKINIIIETKIRNAELNKDQLERHKQFFGHNKPIIIEKKWDEVLDFLRVVKDRELNNSERDNRLIVLISEYLNFCIIKGIGNFEHDKNTLLSSFQYYYDIAVEIDEFLLNGMGIGVEVYEHDLKVTKNGINYNMKENALKDRFAKLEADIYKNKYQLILHFCKSHEKEALLIQEEYNIPVTNNPTTHELWIRLEWIVEGKVKMETVKELCRLAYLKKYNLN
ncbi:hypothetical protein CIB95_11680 [Lottiidibacillus patelloidae]|uniref:Uncharacterized protein n=1 Tax=Lottiidibacillus patelloidae TaxID=2670334 RepID=A0A263BS80_9BACI|nr:hypothetical protein [Lottiidibacillus patelloidae]OZM56428.1 hypothetical protein CIB95_11680 [Lottiidibacillus patelloidae]